MKKIISNKLFISYVKLQIQYNENNKEKSKLCRCQELFCCC